MTKFEGEENLSLGIKYIKPSEAIFLDDRKKNAERTETVGIY